MDYEKAYKEALKRADTLTEKYGGRDFAEYVFPELAESEDERIRKELIEALKTAKTVGELKFILPEPIRAECIAYLEKQKEQPTNEEMLRTLRVEYEKGVTDTIAKYEQKDASKAIEAVERIDKYIDEHLANAHDMKDSDPVKKYYRGWDDALGELAKILLDVYSGENQTEQKPVEKKITLTSFEEALNTFLFNFANSPIEDCEPKEYVKKYSAEILKVAYKELNAKLQQDIFEAQQEGRREGYEVAKAELKPAEWSEEDEEIFKGVYGKIDHDQSYMYRKLICSLGSNPSVHSQNESGARRTRKNTNVLDASC